MDSGNNKVSHLQELPVQQQKTRQRPPTLPIEPISLPINQQQAAGLITTNITVQSQTQNNNVQQPPPAALEKQQKQSLLHVTVPPQSTARPATVIVMPRHLQDQQNNNISFNSNNNHHANGLENSSNETNNNHTEGIVKKRTNLNTNSNSLLKTKRNSGNNNHIYINPNSNETNLDALITNGNRRSVIGTETTANGTVNLQDTENQSNNNNNNNNNISNSINNGYSSCSTLNTLNTYLFSFGVNSTETIGAATLNSGSCDLDSNFSQMVAGSCIGNSKSTFSSGVKTAKPRLRRFFDVGTNFYASKDIYYVENTIWLEKKQQQLERAAAVAAANAAFYKQQAKEKKKRAGPPPQARNQASGQLEDPMNRPRRYVTDKKQKKPDDELQLTAVYEKYLPTYLLQAARTFC